MLNPYKPKLIEAAPPPWVGAVFVRGGVGVHVAGRSAVVGGAS